MSSFDEIFEEKERRKVVISKLFWNQGMPLSHVLFQLSVEDLVNMLVQLWDEGKVTPEEIEESLTPAMVDEIEDTLEYLDWHSNLRWAVFEFLYDIREENKLIG